MVWNMWTGNTAWPYLLVIVLCVIGICWVASPAQRSRRRRRDARARIALRRALRLDDES
jgi:hypothetical protein